MVELRKFFLAASLATAVLILVLAPRAWAGDQWLPISQEELKMTSEPKAPGAPAIILYRQVDRDDDQNKHEYVYQRIKILTEEGRKYGNVEIPFNKEYGTFRSLKARVVQPDGTIVPFDGQVYEKTIVKSKGWQYLTKTFSLPDVRVGSIIEYFYTVDLDIRYYFAYSRWVLSSELFTKRARFTLEPNRHYDLRWVLQVPKDTPPLQQGPPLRLEARDISAFRTEDYMPPPIELESRVEFVYSRGNSEKDPAKFWKQEGKERYTAFDSFTNRRKAMEQAVGEIVSPNDAPELKLQKIYARVQKIRNTSFEREKTKEEQRREAEKQINNVEDVWKRGYGSRFQIDALFVALVRAAGFEAYMLDVCTRNLHFFHQEVMNPYELTGHVVLVKSNGKDLYLDPGNPLAPYGILPWSETGVTGLRLDKDGGTWVQTPMPDSSTSRIERKAELNLTPEGSLEGKLTVTYSGLEALYVRMEEREEDEISRKKFLEDQVRDSIPVGIEVELTNQSDWTSSSPTFTAEYKLMVPGWASAAGRRALLPAALFSSHEKHLFEHADRTYPVYFRYPYKETEDVTIAIPAGWKISSVPLPVDRDSKAVAYVLKAEDQQVSLHISRTLRSNLVMLDKGLYDILRGFFQVVRASDEQQIILQPGT